MKHNTRVIPLERGALVKHFHLGERIEKRLTELGMTKAEFGRRINTSRQNVSLILAKPELSTHQTWVISECLGVNFLEELANEYAEVHDEPSEKENTQIEIHLSVPDQRMMRSIAKLMEMFSGTGPVNGKTP